jgi:hypothetical protein
MSRAKTKTPMSQAHVMNKYSSTSEGFGFFPIDVAVFVANAKHRTYGWPFPLKTHRLVPRPAIGKDFIFFYSKNTETDSKMAENFKTDSKMVEKI